MRCDECSNGADAGKVHRLNGDQVAFDHMTIMHVKRVAKHLLDGEAIDDRYIFDHLIAVKANELRDR